MHIEHRLGPPAGRHAALTVNDDGELVICVDATLDAEQQEAAVQLIIEAARRL